MSPHSNLGPMSGTRDWSTLVGGSVLAIAGASIAGIYSFRGAVPVVFVGFCLFAAGYFVARDGLAVVSKLPVSDTVRAGLVPTHSGHWIVRGTLGLVGIYVISAGVTQFSLTVMDPSVPSAVQAGVYSIGGYAWTHVIIHQSLL